VKTLFFWRVFLWLPSFFHDEPYPDATRAAGDSFPKICGPRFGSPVALRHRFRWRYATQHILPVAIFFLSLVARDATSTLWSETASCNALLKLIFANLVHLKFARKNKQWRLVLLWHWRGRYRQNSSPRSGDAQSLFTRPSRRRLTVLFM
jgi:hypothetical protein